MCATMANYISVSGWLECEWTDVPKIRDEIRFLSKGMSEPQISEEQRQLYDKGWLFQTEETNWLGRIFYGMDIKSYSIDYINVILKHLTDKYDLEGVFLYRDHEGENSRMIILDAQNIIDKPYSTV